MVFLVVTSVVPIWLIHCIQGIDHGVAFVDFGQVAILFHPLDVYLIVPRSRLFLGSASTSGRSIESSVNGRPMLLRPKEPAKLHFRWGFFFISPMHASHEVVM